MQSPLVSTFIAFALLIGVSHANLRGAEPTGVPGDDIDLTEISLEDLMNLEVTIVSRSAQKMSELPGAVYVLTGDEIRRSGHSSIPEALRMVPGFHVSRWTTGAWDVTSRGFGPGLSLTSLAYLNQLLVMIDGVVVYTPLFAGVWWPIQDIDLADVDRVEIVRGPGGILWGSNAVHGVVHIITKRAEETQGARVSLRGGTDDRHASARYGGTLGEIGHWRAWVKGAEYDTLRHPFGDNDYDWNLLSAGFRADWVSSERDWTFWTRAWDGEFEQRGFDLITFNPIQVTDKRKGIQLYASSTDTESDGRWQAWFATDQQDLPTLLDIGIDIFDLEYTGSTTTGMHNVSYGIGWRWVHSRLFGDDPYWLAFDPEESRQNTFRAHILDRIDFEETNSSLTFGLVAEHNDFTQFEVQPTARLTWSPRERVVIWASASRAVRTPSLEEQNLSQNSFYVGSNNFHSETLWAFELGGRFLVADWLSVDIAVYHNEYEELHIGYFDPNVFQVFLTNDAKGHSNGLEIALDVEAAEWWRLRSSFTMSKASLETETGFTLTTPDYSPETSINLRSYMDLGDGWEFDTGFYMVEELGPGFKIAEYFRVDARVAWKPTDQWELFLGIQDATHEDRSELSASDLVRRAVYAGLTWGQ